MYELAGNRNDNEKEWRALHGTAVGSADARVLHGAGYEEESGLRLWKRLSEAVGYADSSEVSEQTRAWWDTCARLEDFVCRDLNACFEEGGVILSDGDCYRHTVAPMICTPDGWASDPRGKCPVEIKVRRQADENWTRTGEPPRHVWIQAQHHMAVLGSPRCLMAALIWGHGVVYTWIERDSEWINDVHIPRVAELFEKIADNDSPPLWLLHGNPEAAGRALGELYPKATTDTPVALGGDWVDHDDALREAAAKEREWTSRRKRLENELKHMIAEAPGAVLPNGVRYEWKTVERAGYTVEPTSYRTLKRKEN